MCLNFTRTDSSYRQWNCRPQYYNSSTSTRRLSTTFKRCRGRARWPVPGVQRMVAMHGRRGIDTDEICLLDLTYYINYRHRMVLVSEGEN
jgi:hypothetical protein